MRRSRPLLFGAVMVVHVALLLLVARWHAPVAPVATEGTRMAATMLPLPAPTPPARPVPVKAPVTIPDEAPAPEPSPPDTAGCGVAGAVQAALHDDPGVPAAVASIPGDARSVANAIMLWDGAWAVEREAGPPGVADPVRGAIVAALRDQPPECLDQAMAGPRLFIVAEPGGAASLVVGSGAWRWRDVLNSAESGSATAPAGASIGSHPIG